MKWTGQKKSNNNKVTQMQSYAKLAFKPYQEHLFEYSRTSEDALQMVFFKWLAWKHPEVLAFAIPNGSNKSIQGRILFKLTGLTKGVSDVFIAEPKGKENGLFLEFKNGKKNKVSDEQKEFCDKVCTRGYAVEVCRTIEEAIARVDEYITK